MARTLSFNKNSMSNTSAPKRRRPASRPRRTSRKSSSGGFLGWLHRVPWWSVWIGGILIACAYVFILYYFFVSPTSFRWRALYGEPDYPEGYEVRGIDVSHYQQDIDWERLRNAQVGHVPIRFVISKATEGERLIDENFADNFYRARENDLVRGAYHYFIPSVSPRQQARAFLRQVHLEPGDLPAILDVEERGNKPLRQFQQDVHQWLDIVEQETGTKPIIYTGYKFMVDYLAPDTTFLQYPYWIAHYYVRELSYQGDWALWQYTDCGRVDGIKGRVDCNIFNGSMEDLMRLTIQDREPEEDLPQED